MQHQARSNTKTLTISGAFAIAALATTSASVIARSGCTKQIGRPTSQVNQTEGCGSFTECDASAQCLPTGGLFKECGPPESVPRYCRDYIGGTLNPETGRCEGGTQVGPGYEDTQSYILLYFNPQYCPTPFPA